MEHYKEVNFRNQTYKVGDKVWVLNGGHKEQKYIIDIFDDTPFENSNYVTKCCYVRDLQYNNISKSFARLEECYLDEYDANNAEYRWKSDYDNYVCRM